MTALVVASAPLAGLVLYAFSEAFGGNPFANLTEVAFLYAIVAELVVGFASNHYQTGVGVQRAQRAQMPRLQQPAADTGQQPSSAPAPAPAAIKRRRTIQASTVRNVLLVTALLVFAFVATMVILSIIFG